MIEDSGLSLANLPSSVIERILLQLPIQDIIHFGQTSSYFKDIVFSELFWLHVLEERWGLVTRPSEWLTADPCGYFELSSSKHKFPGTYR